MTRKPHYRRPTFFPDHEPDELRVTMRVPGTKDYPRHAEQSPPSKRRHKTKRRSKAN